MAKRAALVAEFVRIQGNPKSHDFRYGVQGPAGLHAGERNAAVPKFASRLARAIGARGTFYAARMVWADSLSSLMLA